MEELCHGELVPCSILCGFVYAYPIHTGISLLWTIPDRLQGLHKKYKTYKVINFHMNWN